MPKSMKHPISGFTYELDDEGLVQVSDPETGQIGVFDSTGRWFSGEIREADPQILGMGRPLASRPRSRRRAVNPGRRTSTLVDTTRAVVLARRPGARLVADDLQVRELPLRALTAGQALVRNELMSLDPSARGRMDATDKVYTTNFELGGPLDGWAVGQVVESRTEACQSAPPSDTGWVGASSPSSRTQLRTSSTSASSHPPPGSPPLGRPGSPPTSGSARSVRSVQERRSSSPQPLAVSGPSPASCASLLGATRVVGSAGGRRQVRVVDRHSRLRRRDRLPGRESTGEAGRAGPRDRPLLRQRGRRAADRGPAQHEDRGPHRACAAWSRPCRAATRNRPSGPSSRRSFAG